jgi:hypothetical protein
MEILYFQGMCYLGIMHLCVLAREDAAVIDVVKQDFRFRSRTAYEIERPPDYTLYFVVVPYLDV